jgi:hypothetical protein
VQAFGSQEPGGLSLSEIVIETREDAIKRSRQRNRNFMVYSSGNSTRAPDSTYISSKESPRHLDAAMDAGWAGRSPSTQSRRTVTDVIKAFDAKKAAKVEVSGDIVSLQPDGGTQQLTPTTTATPGKRNNVMMAQALSLLEGSSHALENASASVLGRTLPKKEASKRPPRSLDIMDRIQTPRMGDSKTRTPDTHHSNIEVVAKPPTMQYRLPNLKGAAIKQKGLPSPSSSPKMSPADK